MSSRKTMQINSAQDYLTMKKRQLVSATYASTPPEQKDKTNTVYLLTAANRATTRQRFIIPAVSAWGGVPGTASYTNWCSACEAFPGVFSTVNTKDFVNRQALRPIGVRSTVSQ
jgi:hypothetical protein